jgi:transcriptional regulator with XRE-family HTH domain
MEIRDILARNIKRIRRERGLSQEELAHRAEIDRTYISALERRVYAASIDVLGRIAKALDVGPAALLAKPDDASSS